MSFQFRDPIHGFIEVSDLELKIVDSYPFQRLRNIKQLSTTYLVYPGAEHTRFGHSLGVMHLVSRAFDSALKNYEVKFGRKLFDDRRKHEWYRQILRLIALTHDLGHPPFSHGSESLFGDDVEHEDLTKKIICETEISQYIRDIGEEFKEKWDVGTDFDITPELLWLIYGEKSPEMNALYVMPDFKFLKSFMDSELDCDKMDYLLRDSYYCGVNYGKYDVNRLISSLNVFYDEGNRIMQLAVEKGGIHAFEEFVIARYFMFIQVYFHKTRVYLDKLLTDNMAQILPDGKYPENVKEYLQWDDLYAISKIKEKEGIATKFTERKIMSCVYETPAHSNRANDLRLFNAIKRELHEKLPADADIIDDTAIKIPHKIPIVEEYDASSGKGIPILLEYKDEPSSIAVESILLKNLTEAINIKRIYVAKENVACARQVIKNY